MDYEKLYNELQKETEQMKEENDELLTEYESTIKLLTDAVEKYKEDKQSYENQYNDVNDKHKHLRQDLDKYKGKNLDKMKDIELLNKQIDSLQNELAKVTEDKRLLDTKIVTLENDNDYYITKLRENEAVIEDLNCKFESALEENISLQNDFDEFKHTTEEQLQRKAEELEEAKNEIISKEKAMQKEISHNKKKRNKDKEREREKDKEKYKEKELKKALNESKAKDESIVDEIFDLRKSTSKIILPILNDKELYDMNRISSHSFINKNMTNNSSSPIKHEVSIIESNYNNNNNNTELQYEIKSFSIEYPKQKKRKTSKDKRGTLTEDAVENIKEMLTKIQERKKVVLTQKSIINTKLDKIGIKIQ